MSAQRWLTCDLVEEIHQADEVGREVGRIVNSLQAATLPGVIDYGCLKLHKPSLPRLPAAITESSLGEALLAVRSGIGLRAAGHQRPPPRQITATPHEFIVLEGEAAITNRDWDEFLLRLRQSAKSVGFTQGKATGIAAALGEMADNAVVHARSDECPLVGYQALDGAIVCAVADVGLGVLASLRENEQFSHLRSHAEAIRMALQDGVTRYGRGSGGFGFRRVFKSLAALRGTLRFRSGEGCIVMDGTELDADRGENRFVRNRPGFQVAICCRVSAGRACSPAL